MADKKGNKDKFSCEHEPLIFIDPDHIILDELHLLLRVMDVLLENIVLECIDWDKSDNFNKRKCEQTCHHQTKLLQTIRLCGASFDIWEKKNADGKGTGLYDFTSLLGADKKKLLLELPDKLQECIKNETCATVADIWKKFGELYSIISASKESQVNAVEYFAKAKSWICLFTSLRDKIKGYKRARVTPYLHSLVYHVPGFITKYKSVKIFTGQGVEKNNDVARNVVLSKSNKRDPATDVIRLESRQ